MKRHQQYIPLELSGERLERFIAELRDRLLHEFWPHIPDCEYRREISSRLEKSILSAFEMESEKTRAQ